MISEANFSGSFTTKVVPSSALKKEKRTVRTKSDGCKRERSRQSQEEMKKADDAVVTQKLGYQPRKLPRRDPTTSQGRAPILPQFAFFVKNENYNLGVSKGDNAPMLCSLTRSVLQTLFNELTMWRPRNHKYQSCGRSLLRKRRKKAKS